MNKLQIRKKILKVRKKNSQKNFQIDFTNILKILNKNQNISKIVGGYYPYNYEVDAIEILKKFEKQNIQISLPKIRQKSQMDFFHWSSKEPLAINKYGIPEPTSNKIIYPGILLVPLIAFDNNLNRIGYGSGYYDRYIGKMKKKRKIITIGLAYSFQRVKKISANRYDEKLDFIVTEKKIK